LKKLAIMKNKILCLGNEFIKKDSFAKKLGNVLRKEGFEIININDSFELIEHINSSDELIILDVVENLKEVKKLGIDDISSASIMTSHDLDAGFFLKLLGDNKKIKIIGIPMMGDINKIKEDVKELLFDCI
jgi:Ni,Fe-hydrogenase maturation factor